MTAPDSRPMTPAGAADAEEAEFRFAIGRHSPRIVADIGTSCSPCRSPRLEHRALQGDVARAHAVGCSTTRGTSLGRSRPTTHTPSRPTNDIEVHHTRELRHHSER